jgi:hypothetical protein
MSPPKRGTPLMDKVLHTHVQAIDDIFSDVRILKHMQTDLAIDTEMVFEEILAKIRTNSEEKITQSELWREYMKQHGLSARNVVDLLKDGHIEMDNDGVVYTPSDEEDEEETQTYKPNLTVVNDDD